MMNNLNNTPQNDLIYSSLSSKDKFNHLLKRIFVQPWKNFRFPWKKLIVIFVIALLVGSLYLLVKSNQVVVNARAPYDKTGFVSSEDYIKANGNQTTINQNGFQFVIDNKTSLFQFVDTNTNTTWRSNPDTTTKRFLDPFVIYYAGSLGKEISFGVYDNAIAYQDFQLRVTDSSVEILYEVGGKKEVDRNDFPPIISDARLRELVLSKLTEGSTDYRRITEQAYVSGEVNGVLVWKLKEGIQTSILKQLYRIFYEEAGYTKEDLEYDLTDNGILIQDVYPYFEFVVKYQITNKGLEVTIINDSIVEKEKYPLVYIDILPYFGAASKTDTGYSFVPDGSGALINYNSERSLSLPYYQRIYGKDLAKIVSYQEPKSEQISFPVYGMLTNQEGFINIAKNGAEMGAIRSRISTEDNPYNQTYYRFLIRESQPFAFASINSTVSIIQWTPWYATTDFIMEYQFLNEETKDYSGMAQLFQSYLVENGLLVQNDNTAQPVLDLTLLGGYVSKENFLGIPYEKVQNLTTIAEADEIITLLQNKGVTDINVFFQGFANDGLKPVAFTKLKFNSVVGTKHQFNENVKEISDKNVNFYPEMNMNNAYTDERIQVKKDVVRDVFGEVVKNYATDPASLYINRNTRPVYQLHPSTYIESYNTIIKLGNTIDLKNIAFTDLGNQIYGSYQKRETSFRTDHQSAIIELLNQLKEEQYLMMFRKPNLYAVPYADVITDLPSSSTDYQIISNSVPFLQLVLSGYVDYSAQSININDSYMYEWHILKAMETGSNLAMTWSYTPTIELVDSEYSYYYSTYYLNWFEQVIETVSLLQDTDIYSSPLIKHEQITLDGQVTKSTYKNGMEIVYNFGNTSYQYETETIPSLGYYIEKGAN